MSQRLCANTPTFDDTLSRPLAGECGQGKNERMCCADSFNLLFPLPLLLLPLSFSPPRPLLPHRDRT
jgi:hypothetical protein